LRDTNSRHIVDDVLGQRDLIVANADWRNLRHAVDQRFTDSLSSNHQRIGNHVAVAIEVCRTYPGTFPAFVNAVCHRA
jgi:hypothetical protein